MSKPTREELRALSARILGTYDGGRGVSATDCHQLAQLAQAIASAPLGSHVIEKLRMAALTGTDCHLRAAEADTLLRALGVSS